MQSLSKFRTPPCSKTVGIEWELILEDSGYISSGVFKGFFYCTTDGSIRDRGAGYGREFVSQPLQPKWLVKELARLNRTIGAYIRTNDTCGIHVHVSRKWATSDRINSVDQFLRELSTGEYLDAFGRSPNEYSRHQTYGSLGNTRYMALNVENKATVEFRVFRSGDLKWAQYCVLLVEYIMENAKHLNKDAFFAFVDSHKPS
jgi:hypothetical protein